MNKALLIHEIESLPLDLQKQVADFVTFLKFKNLRPAQAEDSAKVPSATFGNPSSGMQFCIDEGLSKVFVAAIVHVKRNPTVWAKRFR